MIRFSSVILLMMFLLYSSAFSTIYTTSSRSTTYPSQHSSSTTTTNRHYLHHPTLLQSSQSRDNYDLAVIGGGVVGVQAALAAASEPFNKRVCLIDAPRESGVLMAGDEDLSIGAPTGLFGKALRDTSKRIKVSTLRGMGLREDSIWNEIMSSCVDLAYSNADDIRRQLYEKGVDVIEGLASFADGGGTDSLFVTKENFAVETLKAKNYLIATGSQPFRPAGVPFDGIRVFDSDSINQLSFLPKSLVITGSGIIAIEYAKIFRNLGTDVTMVIRDNVPKNALQKIGLDKDVAATLVADMVRSGIKIERGAQVAQFKVPVDNSKAPITMKLTARGGGKRPHGCATEIQAQAYLAAVGRKPNTPKLNLQSAGIQVDEYGGILVDSRLCSTASKGNVYAAGDVLGRPFLASTGTAQGLAAVASMFGTEVGTGNLTASQKVSCDPDDLVCIEGGVSQAGTSFDPASLAANPNAVPCGIWSMPEAAYFGLSLQQAKELGIDAGEGVALYMECLRGRVFSPNGLLKIVFEKPAGRILGVHIVGDDACELIHYGMELINGRRTVTDLRSRLYAAVTFHEMYRLAAEDGLDPAVGRKRRAAAGKALARRNRMLQTKNEN